MKRQLTLLICWGLLFSSCVPAGGDQKRKLDSLTDTVSGGTVGGGNADSGGQGASAGSDSSIINTLTSGGKQELRHIIDPFDGTYKTKVTIPKNYRGKLHLSGLNFSSLKDRIISARFRFGQEKEEIIIEGVIGRVEGGGITPQTDIQMLTLDMSSQPFKDIRLNYDLYDYNDYDTDDDGEEFGANDDLSEPITDYRDTNLFCRGLNLEDDPTFQITDSNDKCDAAGEKCHYSYAKVLDSGLYYLDGVFNRAINPSEPAIELGTAGYAGDSQSDQLKKCLPDTWNRSSIETALQTTMNSANTTIVAYGDTGFAGDYTYNGPFRTADRANWEITSDALFSDVSVAGTAPTGLFQYVLTNAPAATVSEPNLQAQGGVKSFLFPRSGRLDLSNGIQYMGFTDLTDPLGMNNANAARSVQEMISSGDSDFVDGCSMRMLTKDSNSGEGISSCNVTATIDLIYTDENNSIVTLASSREIKLQLARASEIDKFGNEVLSTSLKACSSNNACGSSECCFNNRCWSNDLVAQCLDNDDGGYGNLTTGDSCSSDLQCSSLCCGSTGVCSVHVNTEDEQALCGKSPGQFCVSKEFCRLDYVDTCFLVKTGGNSCGIRCYKVPTFGDCINGRCQQPTAEPPPEFDVSNPDCSLAIDPPTEFDPSN